MLRPGVLGLDGTELFSRVLGARGELWKGVEAGSPLRPLVTLKFSAGTHACFRQPRGSCELAEWFCF